MVGREHNLTESAMRSQSREGQARDRKLTRLSPFSLVMLAGNPAGKACWKMSIWPARAASYILAANASASGGIEGALGSMFILSAIAFSFALGPLGLLDDARIRGDICGSI